MELISNISFGLQIGFQISAAVYCFRIARMTVTPSAPYYAACISLVLMGLWRLNKIAPFLNEVGILIITSSTAVLWLYFFMKIFNLLKAKKYE